MGIGCIDQDVGIMSYFLLYRGMSTVYPYKYTFYGHVCALAYYPPQRPKELLFCCRWLDTCHHFLFGYEMVDPLQKPKQALHI